uniref:Uncharacterized protein n=1 Tax=Knipowitschia caucasica TaxID=637954 RepID=A0AAV2MP01_KNICA
MEGVGTDRGGARLPRVSVQREDAVEHEEREEPHSPSARAALSPLHALTTSCRGHSLLLKRVHHLRDDRADTQTAECRTTPKKPERDKEHSTNVWASDGDECGDAEAHDPPL